MSRVTTTEGTSGWKGEERAGGSCRGGGERVPRTSLTNFSFSQLFFFKHMKNQRGSALAPAHAASGLELRSDHRSVAYLCQWVHGSRHPPGSPSAFAPWKASAADPAPSSPLRGFATPDHTPSASLGEGNCSQFLSLLLNR